MGKDDSKLITIIVPVYNNEKYIETCLKSIINQTYTKFEAIVVDDGSLDHCGIKCDEWAEKDKRIVALHKSNGVRNDL